MARGALATNLISTLIALRYPQCVKGFLFIIAAMLAVDAALNHSGITISMLHGAMHVIHGFKSSLSGSIFSS